MESNPESLPKLDWAHYKKNIAISGMVDKFQKEYDSLKITYPEDKYTSAVDAQEREVVRNSLTFTVSVSIRKRL